MVSEKQNQNRQCSLKHQVRVAMSSNVAACRTAALAVDVDVISYCTPSPPQRKQDQGDCSTLK